MQTLQSIAEALAQLATTPRTALLLALLVAAAIQDVRSYRIANTLTFGGALAGLLVATFDAPVASAGLLNALAGLAVGLGCLLPLHALRVMGGGDVKLMAMAGAFLGWPDVLPALFFVFATGGAAALGYALVRRAARRTFTNVGLMVRAAAFAALTGTRPGPTGIVSAGRLPYGLCICVGTAAFLVVRQLVTH